MGLFNMGVGSSDTILLAFEYLHRHRRDRERAARYVVLGVSLLFSSSVVNHSNCQVYLLLCLTCAKNECLSLFELCHVKWKHIPLFSSWMKPSFTSMVQCKHSQIPTKWAIFRPLKRPSYALKRPFGIGIGRFFLKGGTIPLTSTPERISDISN